MKEMKSTIKYSLVDVGNNGFTVIRNSDKIGLPIYGGQSGKQWASNLSVCSSEKFNSVNDYEFKTCDELTDYSYLYFNRVS